MSPPELAALQREVFRLVSAIGGVEEALAEAGDPEGRSLAALVQSDARGSARERLGIYAFAYFQRIHEALRSDYGALAAAVGDAAFHDLAKLYLHHFPSEHPSLRHAGARLPGFLRHHHGGEPFRRRFRWAPDLAELEWAIVDAFDAPDSPRATRDALAGLAPERWAGLRIELQPALRLLPLAWPVHGLRRDFDGGRGLAPPAAEQPVQVRVWRQDERVFFRVSEPLEAVLLGAALRGAVFGELCEAAAQRCGEDAAPGFAAASLAGWIEDGLVSGFSYP